VRKNKAFLERPKLAIKPDIKIDQVLRGSVFCAMARMRSGLPGREVGQQVAWSPATAYLPARFLNF
jgi:hypothetical protein